MGRCGVYLMFWYSYLCFCTYYFQEYRLFYTISSTDFLPEDFSLDIKSAQPTKCRSLELPWSQCLRATPTQKYTASFPLEQTIISHRICTQQDQRAIARLHSSCPQQQVTIGTLFWHPSLSFLMSLLLSQCLLGVSSKETIHIYILALECLLNHK